MLRASLPLSHSFHSHCEPGSQEYHSRGEPQQCSNPTQILVSIHVSVLCWAEPHWAVQRFTLEWPEVGINPLIRLPSPLFLSPLDPGANQQLFVHCHLTNDFLEGGGGEKGEGARANKSESINEGYNKPVLPPFFFSSALFRSLLSAFLFHSPHGRRNGCCCVFICRPVELLWLSQVTVAGCVWGMSLHGSACPSRRSASVSACLHWTKPCFAVHFKAVVWRFNEVKNITKSLSL